ncbi:MAG: HAD family phosphatase [Candidatus Riflebacteria bacterium]|nr:HAD family phosphatase [Candidatus Riflebacteria bacterium]
MAIKNVIFDFGNVLVAWEPRHLYRKYFKTEAEVDYFLRNICTEEWNTDLDRGEPFEKLIQERIAKFPEFEEPIRFFKDRWEEMIYCAKDETVEFIFELKAGGYRLYGLSNWSAETFPIALKKYQFFELFDGIVISGQEGVVKPNAEIYRILLDRYGLKAGESVFIDDKEINVKAGEALGIKGIVFDKIENVKRRFADLTK